MSEFFVGQKVVCIRGGIGRYRGYGVETFPVKDGIYTIRDLLCPEQYAPDRYPHVRLEEIKNPILAYAGGPTEAAFSIDRFRPLDSKAIEIFRKIARDVTERAKAPRGVA